MRTGWIGAEDESVLPIAECVEDHLKRVHLRHAGIAARVAHDNLGRAAVVANDPDIQIRVVENEADLGSFRRGLTFEGLGLGEILERRGLLPGRVVQRAVD